MALGVRLVGNLGDGSMSEGWLTRVQEWLHENWSHTLMASEIADDAGGRARLSFQLHPAAVDIGIVASGRHSVELEAETHAAGPGYHAHVCELLQALGDELAAEWSITESADSTGFLEMRDRSRLEEAMIAELRADIRRVLARIDAVGCEGAALNLDAGHEYEIDEAAATPLGPRDRTWLEQALTDASLARDVFPWWEPGVGAQYRLGRALVEMWLHVRWRRPLDAEESGLLEGVLALLETAYASNPRLAYPWTEWKEIRDFSGVERRLPPHQLQAPGRAIGYRRRPVRVRLRGGWSIRVPGSFAERWDETSTFNTWDGTRALWVSEGADASPDEPPEEAAEVATRRNLELGCQPPYRGEVTAYDVLEPVPVRKLEAKMGVSDYAARVTVVLDSPDDEVWAIDTIKSLRHVAA